MSACARLQSLHYRGEINNNTNGCQISHSLSLGKSSFPQDELDPGLGNYSPNAISLHISDPFLSQGDQFRRLHPELSRLESPCKFGIYSLKLKAQLLDNLTRQQAKAKSVPKQTETETDSSNGLVSRLDKVRITSEVDDNCRSNGKSQISSGDV